MTIQRPAHVDLTHSIAFVLLYLAQRGDDEGATDDELATIEERVQRVNERLMAGSEDAPALTKAEVDETRSYFFAMTEDEQRAELDFHLDAIRDKLPRTEARYTLVKDLIAVAEADGVTTEGEKQIVLQVFKALGLKA